MFIIFVFEYTLYYTSSFAARHIGEATNDRRTRASPSGIMASFLESGDSDFPRGALKNGIVTQSI